jgi:hypothetical protein
MATARRLIFLNLKASIADLITLLFSPLKNSEGGGDGDSGDSCAFKFGAFEESNLYSLPYARQNISSSSLYEWRTLH